LRGLEDPDRTLLDIAWGEVTEQARQGSGGKLEHVLQHPHPQGARSMPAPLPIGNNRVAGGDCFRQSPERETRLLTRPPKFPAERF